MNNIKDNEYIRKTFEEVAENMTYNAELKFNDAITHYNKSNDPSLSNRKGKLEGDVANRNFADSVEMSFKSNLIYDDMSKDERFNSLVDRVINFDTGTGIIERGIVPGIRKPYWIDSLKGVFKGESGYLKAKYLNIISDPKEIRKMIIKNNPLDERAKIETDPIFNSQFLTLSFDGTKTNGHSLYSYYQLLSSVPKNLSNFELFVEVPGEEKYTVYGLLFGSDDILKISDAGKTIMTTGLMEKINDVKDYHMLANYNSISTDYQKTPDNSLFLKNLSESLLNVTKYRFPMDLEKEKYNYESFFAKDLKEFEQLDSLSKYYLQDLFDKSEIDYLIEFINHSRNSLTYNIYDYINDVIYIKYYCINNNIPGSFAYNQYERIYALYSGLISFQVFDPSNKLLKDYSAFDSEEKISVYIKQMNAERNKEYQEKLNLFIEQQKEVINSYIDDYSDYIHSAGEHDMITKHNIIKSLDEYKNRFIKTEKEYNELVDEIKKEIESVKNKSESSYETKFSYTSGDSSLVKLQKYRIANSNNPFVYTHSIHTCIGLLIHRDNSAILAHIFPSFGFKDVIEEIKNLKDDTIRSVELYIGKDTKEESIQLIIDMFPNIDCSVKQSFVDMYGNGSIGYNYVTDTYYKYDDYIGGLSEVEKSITR